MQILSDILKGLRAIFNGWAYWWIRLMKKKVDKSRDTVSLCAMNYKKSV
jgi:hypothetical protein